MKSENSGNIYNFSGQFLLLGTCAALHSCNIFFPVVKLPPFIETRHDGRSIFQAMLGIFQAVFIVYADDRYIAMIFCYDHRQSPFNGIKESFFRKLQIIHEGIFCSRSILFSLFAGGCCLLAPAMQPPPLKDKKWQKPRPHAGAVHDVVILEWDRFQERTGRRWRALHGNFTPCGSRRLPSSPATAHGPWWPLQRSG